MNETLFDIVYLEPHTIEETPQGFRLSHRGTPVGHYSSEAEANNALAHRQRRLILSGLSEADARAYIAANAGPGEALFWTVCPTPSTPPKPVLDRRSKRTL